MPLYFVFTRLANDSWKRSHGLETLEHQVADCVRVHCPDVNWIANFSMPGTECFLDVIEAPYSDAALRLAVLIRNHGFSHVEVQTRARKVLIELAAAKSRAPVLGPSADSAQRLDRSALWLDPADARLERRPPLAAPCQAGPAVDSSRSWAGSSRERLNATGLAANASD